MRCMIRSTLSILLLVAAVMAAESADARGQLMDVVIHSPALEGNALGDSPERSALVYLPPGYTQTDQRYPVLYLLHGFNTNHRLWVGEGFFGPMDIAAMLDEAIQSGRIGEMIVVMPDASNAYLGSFYANSAISGNWEDFIAEDLVAHIDASYRTEAQPASRGIGGQSMGGQGAMTIAMKHPGIFGSVYAMSGVLSWDYWEASDLILEGVDFDGSAMAMENGSLWTSILSLNNWDDVGAIPMSWHAVAVLNTLATGVALSPDAGEPFLARFPFSLDGDRLVAQPDIQRMWHEATPLGLLETGVDAGRLARIKFDCGTADEFVLIRAANHAFSDALTAAGVAHEFETYDGTHLSGAVERLNSRLLPFFSEALAARPLVTAIAPSSWGALKAKQVR